MGDTRVDFNALGEGSSSVQATFQALQSTLDGLEARLEPMLGTWSGEAREAYAVQKRAWEQASSGMAEVLRRIGQELGQAQQNYQHTEDSNRGLWQ